MQVVTIDGPAASGKSSAARKLAERLRWQWMSTGAYYRAVAYIALQRRIPPESEAAVEGIVRDGKFEVVLAPDTTHVIYQGEDITDPIQAVEIGTVASIVSPHPKVRELLQRMQRETASNTAKLVAEGRDCGTKVFPDALLKFWLTASPEARARRRAQERTTEYSSVLQAIRTRDEADKRRDVDPMLAPPGAVRVDTTEMTELQMVDHLYQVVLEKAPSTQPG